MTPPAAAARRATAGARRAAGAPPRRISGPLRPAPAGPRIPARTRTRPAPGIPFAAGLRRRLRELPDHRLVDRLIGGRVWIPLVAVLLLGLVTMQVSLLKLNAGIGQAVTQESAFQRENAALRASNGRLSSGERVREAALRAGLSDPGAGSVRFLRSRKQDAARAAVRTRAPSATLAAESAAATTPAPIQTAAPAPVVSAPATPVAATTPATTAPATTTPTTTPAATTPATTQATTPSYTPPAQSQVTPTQATPTTQGTAVAAVPTAGGATP